MGTNFHTAWIDKPTPGYTVYTAASMNPPLAALDKAITYLKNIIVNQDGTLTYDSATGQLAWDGTIRIFFNRADGDAVLNTIAAGNITLADGEFAYVDLNETDESALTMQKAAITTDDVSNFIAFNRLVMGYRNATSHKFYPIGLTKVWQESGEVGDVTGPEEAVEDNLPAFSDATGKLIKDSGIAKENVLSAIEATGQFNANIVIFPEYPGAVLTASGSDNTGEMTSESEVVDNVRHNYYEWISDEAGLQNYDIDIQLALPHNFLGFQAGVGSALTVYFKTANPAAATSTIDVTINKDGTADESSLEDLSSNDVWDTDGFDDSDDVLASLVAGDVLNIKIRLYSKLDNYARIGRIILAVVLQGGPVSAGS